MNNIFIISGPSGVGEDSVIQKLGKIIEIERVVTSTTRDMRHGESQKNPYYFISKSKFLAGIKNNLFLEYAQEYNNNYYGVTYEEIDRVKQNGKTGIWKIEYKGVITAKKVFPDIKAILLKAPLDILEKRIRNRGNISEEYIKERMNYTKEWLNHKHIYDYEIVNEEGKLEETVKKVLDIIQKFKII